MILFWLIAGSTLPTLIGWLLIKILEGKTPVLFRFERWVLGFLLGLTFTIFITFVVHITTKIVLSRNGYLIIQIGLIVLLGLLWTIFIKGKCHTKIISKKYDFKSLITNNSLFVRSIIILLIIWTLIKILTVGITFLTLTPSFLDDVMDNWNLRGKVYFTEQQIQIELPNEEAEFVKNRHSSYPPTIPLVKAQLSAFAGKWDEGLVNSIHLFWYLATLILLFYAIFRKESLLWALFGTYILSSLPLYLMHGTNPYGDVFLSAHIFVAISMLFNAVSSDEKSRGSFFRIGALATALLVFTKNEALLIHIPAILLILLLSLLWLKHSGKMSFSQCVNIIIWYVILLLATALPWIIFKWTNGLTFGNAQSIANVELNWHTGVIKSILINTFLEGNWLLLFPLVFSLLIIKKEIAFKTPLLVLTGFFLIIYFGQIPLYMFTYLYVEATKQTGYARGLVQLAPVIVLIVTFLASHFFYKELNETKVTVH